MTLSMPNQPRKRNWDVRHIRQLLANEAEHLRHECGFSGPPYDPYSVASFLNVEVEERDIPDFDGYIEMRGTKYVAVISAKKRPTRQRFTLGHELGHVLLMKLNEGKVRRIERKYRTSKHVTSLHQDPVEESLCNYFAGELLMPQDEVKNRLEKKDIEPQTIFSLAKEFDVSIQAAAVKVVKSKKRVMACTLWSLDSLWPLPVWWVGTKTKLVSELRALEFLVGKREDWRDLWESYGESDCAFEIRVSPSPERRFAMIVISHFEEFQPLRSRWQSGMR